MLQSAEQANKAAEKLAGRMCMGQAMYVTRVSAQPSNAESPKLLNSVTIMDRQLNVTVHQDATTGSIVRTLTSDMPRKDRSLSELVYASNNQWLASDRTVVLTAPGSLLGDPKADRDNAFIAARLLDICHIVVGVNTVSNMNVSHSQIGGKLLLNSI